ncbi:hypothetical protein [Humidesulfovibrio idahonensis]
MIDSRRLLSMVAKVSKSVWKGAGVLALRPVPLWTVAALAVLFLLGRSIL